MFDIEHETLVRLSDAAQHPLLKRPKPAPPVSRAVLERWRTRGVRGVVLETVKIGGTRYTSKEAIIRFIERCSDPKSDTGTVTRGQISKAHAQAERELEAAGI